MLRQPYLEGFYFVLEEVERVWYKPISPACKDAQAARDWQKENQASFPEGKYIGRWAGTEWEDVVRISE